MKTTRTSSELDSHNLIKKPPVHSLGGRPPKFTIEARTLILDALRTGKSYAAACLAASISPVALFMWRRAHPRFDAQCRNARARGKKHPNAIPEQATMIDSYGNIVPNSEIVVGAKEQARLQQGFDKRQKELRRQFFTKDVVPQKQKRLQPSSHDDIVHRLINVREGYEAELKRKAEAEEHDGNRTVILVTVPHRRVPATGQTKVITHSSHLAVSHKSRLETPLQPRSHRSASSSESISRRDWK